MPATHANPTEGLPLPIVDGPVDLLLQDRAVAVDRAERGADVVGEGGEGAVLGAGCALAREQPLLVLEADLASEPRVLELDSRMVRYL